MESLHLAPIDEIVARHISGDVSIDDTVASCTNRINDVNDLYNAVVWSDPAFIAQEIKRAHSQLESGGDFPLLGVPLLVKEIDSAIEGTPNTWGNVRMHEVGYCDSVTATSVTLLQNAGAVIVGKTNNPELALASTTDSRVHGPCNNPLDVTRNTGGSSGGAAAAVASGMVNVATASDGGGSTRIPASNCGVFGFKPSRGRISLGPLIDEAWAGLVCKGLIASNMTDLRRVLDVLTENTINASVEYEKPLRIGVRTTGFGSLYPMDPHVVTATQKLSHFLESMGHHIEYSHPRSYDDAEFITPFLNIIAYNTFLDIGFISQLTNNTLDVHTCDLVTQYFYSQGEKMRESHYVEAQQAIAPFTHVIDEWFNDFDILITPTCGNVAPLHGEVEKDPDIAPLIYGGLCMPSNVSGTPAISVPVRTDHPSGLPCGVQIVAARGNDELALRLASTLERDYSDVQVTVSSNITS